MSHEKSHTKPLRAFVFTAYTAGFFLSCILRSANASLDEALRSGFAIDETSVGLLSSFFFLAFAIMQLPLGYLIDRVGPRRAQLIVLPLAIVGLVASAFATGFISLTAGRVLMGVGFAISLMASLCANRTWFSVASLAAVNGAAIGIGSSGSAFAGLPLANLEQRFGWTELHIGLASCTALVLMIIFLLPKDRVDLQTRGAGQSGLSFMQVLRDPVFVRLVPLAALAQGSYLAYLGYWIHPWLRSVSDYNADQANLSLTLAASTMVAGYLLTGPILRLLRRWELAVEQGAIVGMAFFALVGIALGFLPSSLALPLWLFYGFTGALNVVAFSVLSSTMPQSTQGVAVTWMNLLIFAIGFAVQAALGFGVDWIKAAGFESATAHRAGLTIISLALLTLVVRWHRLNSKHVADIRVAGADNRAG